MDPKKLIEAVERLVELANEINRRLSEKDKGGPGSGCSGGHCGRPPGHAGDHTPTVRPRSGIRPSTINPNRREIEYHEEPSSDNRPRSGVRPTSAKPKG